MVQTNCTDVSELGDVPLGSKQSQRFFRIRECILIHLITFTVEVYCRNINISFSKEVSRLLGINFPGYGMPSRPL